MNTHMTQSAISPHSMTEAAQFLALPRKDRLTLMDEALSRVERAARTAKLHPNEPACAERVMLNIDLLTLTTEIMLHSDTIDLLCAQSLRGKGGEESAPRAAGRLHGDRP